MRFRPWVMVILAALSLPAWGQESFKGCGMEGDALKLRPNVLDRQHLQKRIHLFRPHGPEKQSGGLDGGHRPNGTPRILLRHHGRKNFQ